jgi:hypothetical protein
MGFLWDVKFSIFLWGFRVFGLEPLIKTDKKWCLISGYIEN